MFRKTPIFILLALMLGAVGLSAQTQPKYGHTNLGNLLEAMPETKKANDALKAFTDSLSTKDEVLVKAFQEASAKFEKDYTDRILTPIQTEQRQAELQKQQEEIQKFEQGAQQAVAAKREELLKPILQKINDAVKTVATEGGYLMIFDTSSGAMLFASETDDVSALVKKKLGL